MEDKNNYHKLFKRLSELKPNQTISIEEVEDLGFFLSELKDLNKEKFIYLKNLERYGYQINLAPRGFSLLYKIKIDENQTEMLKKQNFFTEVLALATIVLSITAFFTFFKINAIFDHLQEGWGTTFFLFPILIVTAIGLIVLPVAFLALLIKTIKHIYFKGRG